jgi:hypothetical protein
MSHQHSTDSYDQSFSWGMVFGTSHRLDSDQGRILESGPLARSVHIPTRGKTQLARLPQQVLECAEHHRDILEP